MTNDLGYRSAIYFKDMIIEPSSAGSAENDFVCSNDLLLAFHKGITVILSFYHLYIRRFELFTEHSNETN